MASRFFTPVLTLLCSLIFSFPAAAQETKSKLGDAEKLVKEHIEKVMGEEKRYESYGKEIAEKAKQDSKAGNAFGHQAAKKHPWDPTGNPLSQIDYFLDSFFSLDARVLNAFNWSAAWSCFEPKLLAKATNGREIVRHQGPGNMDLIAECRSKCVNYIQHIPFERGSLIGAIMYDAFGCFADPDPWGYTENGYEVVEYWFPEYQISINNFGINRIKPEQLSPSGGALTRTALVSAKKGQSESEIRNKLAEAYPLDMSKYKEMPNREDPYLGQGVWGGYAFPDFEDKSYAHVYRTWLSTTMGEKKKEIRDGWMVNPEDSVYDALPKRIREHDPVNMWTEYGMFDVLTSMPQMSYEVRSDIMQALHGSKAPYSKTAREKEPHPVFKGAMAYRVQKWPQYKPLTDVIKGLQGTSNDALKESVYKGGYELFPLVMNQSGFGAPVISSSAIFARRAAYIAGARSPKERGGDEGGSIAQMFNVSAEMQRIATYTIDEQNKDSEIDKLNLTAMKRPKDGTTFGGVPPMISECFRSQNIPNLVNPDKKLEDWVNKNLSRKLPGYYSDIDFISQQGGDITFTYWNRRIGCFCDRCGIPHGSTSINDGGDGDKLYDKKRIPFCRYPLMPTMKAWNAWARTDNFPLCQANGLNEAFYDGTGLRDQQ